METTCAVRAQALQREVQEGGREARRGQREEVQADQGPPDQLEGEDGRQGCLQQEEQRRAQQQADDLLEDMARWIDQSDDEPTAQDGKQDDKGDPTTPKKRARRTHPGVAMPEKTWGDMMGSAFHLTEELAKEITPTQAGKRRRRSCRGGRKRDEGGRHETCHSHSRPEGHEHGDVRRGQGMEHRTSERNANRHNTMRHGGTRPRGTRRTKR